MHPKDAAISLCCDAISMQSKHANGQLAEISQSNQLKSQTASKHLSWQKWKDTVLPRPLQS